MNAIFVHRLDVRFRDCDPMGHANNAVYLTYLEQARFAHWREIWGSACGLNERPEGPRAKAGGGGNPGAVKMNFERLPQGTPGVILARAEIDYLLPARYGDVLEIRIGLERIGRTSFTYVYELFDQQARLVARARSVQVLYDYDTARPVPLSKELKAKLGVPEVS